MTQQLAGILSPVILIFMIVLINRKDIMGKYINTRMQNVVSILTVVFISVLSIILVISSIV